MTRGSSARLGRLGMGDSDTLCTVTGCEFFLKVMTSSDLFFMEMCPFSAWTILDLKNGGACWRFG